MTDVASDFVLVAATLLDMKASALVPEDASLRVDKDDDEDEDLLKDFLPMKLGGADRTTYCL